ncbi:ROK family protein [Paenibacillus sp. FSL H3-0469]|uniref:ROK family protein n=1 Tax=Paenibacillus sp. FSL H3-0469 TaxID=2954506 RepID=UPI003100DE92
MRIANANLMKEINLNNVRQVMKRMETATKPQLAAMTKLSVVTVNSLVKELSGLGELFEDLVVPSNGGRPAQTYRFNYNFSLALVMYVTEKAGKVLVSVTVINLKDDILMKDEHIIPVFERDFFYTIIEHALSQYPAIKVIGIGIPGQAVNGEIKVSSLRELTGSRLIEEIETRFGLPILVENDVNAAISGYCMKHSEGEEQYLLGLYFPNGYPPGMGIYLNGSILKGNQGMSGEVKFLPDMPEWSLEMTRDAFIAATCRILQTVNAVLAPDRIVIYQDRVEEEVWTTAWTAYQLQHPMPVYPEVVLQHTFQDDFEHGLRRLTLKELEPEPA